MAFDPATLPPDQAWTPLPPGQWDAAAARHLLQRIGFSALPGQVDRALALGLDATLEESFGQIRPLPQPPSLVAYAALRSKLITDLHTFENQPEPTCLICDEFNVKRRQALRDAIDNWLAFAREPANSAQEKLVLWLSNVLVISANKVNDPERLFAYYALLRSSWPRPYPEICRAITYSPAMMEYLDSNTFSWRGATENYARELMELFTLGEGNYTESDVKEITRAFTGLGDQTGYAITNEQGQFDPARWDPGPKTIFGQTGHWRPDDVINLIFTQPAARTHLPSRFLVDYLSADPLPKPYLDHLGDLWVRQGWRLEALVKLVFSSRLFYEPSFRGNLIKSPVHFYLGLCQDLDLAVCPVALDLLPIFEGMGQSLYTPENVRGWLGGRHWINSTTYLARCQLVQTLFTPEHRTGLNDEPNMTPVTSAPPPVRLDYVDPRRLEVLAALPNDELAGHLLRWFLPGASDAAYFTLIIDFLQNARGPRLDLVRDATVNLLQSPLYQMC